LALPEANTPAQVAASAAAVPDSRVRELAEIAMQMEGVYKLYFGESDLPTPEFIKRAAQEAMAQGFTYYTENAGLPSLREAIARYTHRLHGVPLDPSSEIAVTASGVQALSVSLRCLVDPGDEALVLTPAWPNGAAILRMSHAVVKQIAQPRDGRGYVVDFDALEAAITPRTRVLLYTSPSNPLGWVATREDQLRLLDFARRHHLWLVADEVYERLCYAGTASEHCVAPSILRLCSRHDAVAVIQSFSKAWCMTGWRLGWLTARRDLIARASRINEFLVSCPVAFVQKAGETALEHGEASLKEMLAHLRENRDLCLEALNSMPRVSVPVPEGAFYLFPEIDGVADSFAFCKRLLLEAKVGLAPGVAFGAGGEGSVRLCYASRRNVLEAALARLKGYLESRARSSVG
jgi:aspartate/methionine/tyrosine aminotransferase